MRNDYVVYIHKNISNGKVYVGQTCNLSERWRNNGKNYFNSIKFYNAIKKYGWNNFTHEVVYSNLNKQAADKLEKELIYKYKCINMIPINQVILGGGDPLLGNSMVGNSLDEQLQLIEKYKQNLEAAKQLRQQVQPVQQPVPQRMIWDEIDAEISPMTDEQKTRMLQDEDYVDTYTKIQDMVQAEILDLVKGRIEATPEGKELLQRQLKIVKKLKGKIIQETNREMEMFRKFREFSKTHPEVTYEEFIKASM